MSDAQFIKAPNNLSKAKLGSGKGKLDPAVLQRAEQVVETFQSEYTEWAEEDLGALGAALAKLQAGTDEREAVMGNLYRISLAFQPTSPLCNQGSLSWLEWISHSGILGTQNSS